MKLQLICFGKMDNNGYSDLEKYYLEKIKRFTNIEIIAVKEENTDDIVKNMKKNEETIEKYIYQQSIKYLLDFNGKTYTSEDFAKELFSNELNANTIVQFYIGPSDGFSVEFRKRFTKKIAFGASTMPHQLARIVLLEQLFRSYKIKNNEKYHK